MRPVAVATDSTHYLPRSLADREGVNQVSLYVGWQEGRERELDMDGFDAFYERLRSDPELPTTSQPSIGDFLEVWEPLIEDGRDVVAIHLAGGISGTVEAADDVGRRLEQLKRALYQTPTVKEALKEQARDLERRNRDILRALRGDVVLRGRSENTPTSIAERVQ